MPPRWQLLDLVRRGGVCAEVGVWKGDFAKEILGIVEPSKLHLIDPWQAVTGEAYKAARYGGKLDEGQSDMDALYQGVLDRFAKQRRSGVVSVHRMPSQDAAATLPDSHFDFIYLDGNHRYEFVRGDLAAFAPKLRAGGVLAGDDYGLEGWWKDGVTRAVDEFVAKGAATIELVVHRQFALRPRTE
jgi:hypothetical protein